MSNLAVIEKKISSIKKYLKLLQRYKGLNQDKIEADQDLKGAVERYLYLATQATIDLGEGVIALNGFRRPGTYTDIFYILEEENFITKDISEKLVEMSKFRNVIAHDYEKIDFSIVFDALQDRLVDIEGFIKVVEEKLKI
jgi:uncharacterized protein YutE (UPF0331/DUF86 family)